jgi:uncharacterized integral membrane protein
MRLLGRLFWAFIFFTLFTFALNNEQPVALHWFFGYAWYTETVYVVLAAFTLGCVVGVLAMTPSWWHHRRRARQLHQAAAQSPVPSAPSVAGPPVPDVTAIRDGL